MRKENKKGRYRSERETDEEFEARMKAVDNADEMRPYTQRSDLPFIRMAERYGGVVMKEDDE